MQFIAELQPEHISANLTPFAFVDINVFGPIQMSVGRASAKRHGCILTCFSSQAIHLQILIPLDADAFLISFHRFVASRGQPHEVYCDNGTNFCAGEELKREFKRHSEHTLAAYEVDCGIERFFIPPNVPHMGGAWERMVGVVKRASMVLWG